MRVILFGATGMVGAGVLLECFADAQVESDSTERSRTMWARVKGRTQNAILALPFKAASCSGRVSSSR